MTSDIDDHRRPRYQIIADDLINKITSNRISVGSRLPSEKELCSHYGVSRYTVREALRVIKEMGLVSIRRGSGSIVLSSQPKNAHVQSINSLSELLNYPETSFSLIKSGMAMIDGNLANTLNIKKEVWFQISGIRRSNSSNTPICWQDVYVLPEYRDAARQVPLNHRAVHQIIELHHGSLIEEAQLNIFASQIGRPLAKHLEVQEGASAMTIIRLYHDNTGRLFEITSSIHPEGRFIYSLHMKHGKKNSE